MNFFQHQEKAQKNTTVLVFLFLIAVTFLILITAAVVAGFIAYTQQGALVFPIFPGVDSDWVLFGFNWMELGSIAFAVLIVVLAGSIFRFFQFSEGGQAIAEAMGGRLLQHQSATMKEKIALNVVEEMAIASGLPVPSVYLLEEAGINAFAAGFSHQNAVIGLTRGSIEKLTRDELQGVVAHEFSHILHGDMRLNSQLLGLLFGILMIALAGKIILRSFFYRSRSSRSSSKNSNTLPLMLVGLVFLLIGYTGYFFANLIKAAASRQREFLADASAVQYTRNPDGIGGALIKIGGYEYGSQISKSNAGEFSHFFFSNAVPSLFSNLMSTHPKLEERISRIKPNWNRKFSITEKKIDKASQTTHKKVETSSVDRFAEGAETASKKAVSAVDSIGLIEEEHIQLAAGLLAELPAIIYDSAHDPFSARALVYCLLMGNQQQRIDAALTRLQKISEPSVFVLTKKLAEEIETLDRNKRLPLLELCLPTLKLLSAKQYQSFKGSLVDLIRSDGKISLFEWSLYQTVINNLEARPFVRAKYRLSDLPHNCQQLLSLVAYAGHQDSGNSVLAYSVAAQQLSLSLPILGKDVISIQLLSQALAKLGLLKPLEKPHLMRSIALCIQHDNQITASEVELFRAIADNLDCPMPPLDISHRNNNFSLVQ